MPKVEPRVMEVGSSKPMRNVLDNVLEFLKVLRTAIVRMFHLHELGLSLLAAYPRTSLHCEV